MVRGQPCDGGQHGWFHVQVAVGALELDQELSFDELQEINGGIGPFLIIPIVTAVAGVIALITSDKAEQENRKNR